LREESRFVGALERQSVKACDIGGSHAPTLPRSTL